VFIGTLIRTGDDDGDDGIEVDRLQSDVYLGILISREENIRKADYFSSTFQN